MAMFQAPDLGGSCRTRHDSAARVVPLVPPVDPDSVVVVIRGGRSEPVRGARHHELDVSAVPDVCLERFPILFDRRP